MISSDRSLGHRNTAGATTDPTSSPRTGMAVGAISAIPATTTRDEYPTGLIEHENRSLNWHRQNP